MIGRIVLAATLAAVPCPSACQEADTLLQAGDTAAAVETLRELAEARPDDPEVLGRLGRLLVDTAPTRATDFVQRVEAEEILQRAIDLDGADPRWWMARGLLERKRGNQIEARRMLLRAADLAEEMEGGVEGEGTEVLSRTELARLHAEVGRALEEHVMDFRGFIPHHPDLPVVSGEFGDDGQVCPVAFCKNYERPRSFHETLLRYETQDDLVADDRAVMRRHFGHAFQLDPSLALAARGWLGELARSEEWQAYVEVARRHVEAREDQKGWPLAFLGAGRWRMGDEAGADSAFRAALEHLPPDEVRLLRDVEKILRKDAAERYSQGEEERQEAFRSTLWTTLDPLLLTEANERQLEHFTRVALADLWFGEPGQGRRGVETDRGLVYIRYGEPRWIRQVRLESGDLQALAAATGGESARPAAGGRWVFWTYSRDAPSFIFQKALGSRRVSFPVSTPTKEYEEAARARRPSSFRVPNFRPLAHQVARFKGDSVDVDADVVVAVPRVMEGAVRVPARAGFFVLPGAPGQELVRMDTPLDLAEDGGRSVTFRVPVNQGSYPYAVEVVSEDRSVLAADRATLEARAFPPGLALSDILMARSIEPAVSEPRSRRQFRIVPAGDLTFTAGRPLAVYFEIYGLQARGDEPLSRYAVELAVRGEDEGVLGGIVRRLTDVLGRSESGTVTWEGTAPGDRERVPEWFTLSLPELDPGEYRVEVVVRDQIAGAEARTSRTVTLVEGRTGPDAPSGG